MLLLNYVFATILSQINLHVKKVYAILPPLQQNYKSLKR